MNTRNCHQPFSRRAKVQRYLLGLAPLVILLANGLSLSAQAVEFPSTGDRGAPGRTAGGGTRGEWCEDNQWSASAMRALVPSNNVSTFARDEANLWVYTSDMFNEMPAELYVQNADTYEPVYRQDMYLEGLENGGLVKLSVPSENSDGEAILSVGQDYYWELSVICDASDRTRDYIVRGLIHRMEPSAELTAALDTTSQLVDHASLYAQAELWQETLETAAAAHSDHPDLWDSLLESVGLEEMLTLDYLPGSVVGSPSQVSAEPQQVTHYPTLYSPQMSTPMDR